MAQARVEIVFSERREGDQVSKGILRDLEALRKAQSGFKGFKQVTPRVDSSQLHELNALLDVKQKHIEETAQLAARSPIVVQTRLAGFDEVMGQLEQLSRKSNQLDQFAQQAKQNGPSGSASNNQPLLSDSESDEFANTISDSIARAFESVGKGGFLSGIFSPIQSILGSIFAGATEGFGREITKDFTKGIGEGVSSELSSIFGTADLVGKTLAQGITKELIDSLKGDKEFQVVSNIFEQTLGKDNILAASGAQQGRSARKQADEKLAAQLFFEQKASTISSGDILKADQQIVEAQRDLEKALRKRTERENQFIESIAKSKGLDERNQQAIEGSLRQSQEEEERLRSGIRDNDAQIDRAIAQQAALPLEDIEGADALADQITELEKESAKLNQALAETVARQKEIQEIAKNAENDPFSASLLLSSPLGKESGKILDLGAQQEDLLKQRSRLAETKAEGDGIDNDELSAEIARIDSELSRNDQELKSAVANQSRLLRLIEKFSEESKTVRELARDSVSELTEAVEIAQERLNEATVRSAELKRPGEAARVIGSSSFTAPLRLNLNEASINARQQGIDSTRREGRDSAARAIELRESLKAAEGNEKLTKSIKAELSEIVQLQKTRKLFIEKLEEEIKTLREESQK
ncbi:MAG: hypothetical protein HC771_13055 [Synechococcales cyanobacterium CRU_2_2]|nr:hypothetical protein [Synechococcales cyanobacterium CRU_2_2]